MLALERELASVSQRVNVSEINDRLRFVALRSEWDALVEATNDEVFYRHDFIRTWIDNFKPDTHLRILIGRNNRGKLVAALPLIQERALLMGVPVRQLSSTANDHSCRFDLIADDAAAAGFAFFNYLASDTSWDVLRLTDVPESGNAWQLYWAAEEAGFPVGVWESLQSPYVALSYSYEKLENRLKAKFKANLHRRHKRLCEKGAVTLEKVTGGYYVKQRLQQGYALEQRGWKGRGGTAISQDDKTLGFYTDLAQIASDAGYLSLYLLRLNGRPIAFQYGLAYGDRYYLLKPAYDETLKECSPGQLLMSWVLNDCIKRGLSEFDFLGPDMPWKREWADRTRRHDWLFVFSPSPFGRALQSYKFKLLPATKKVAMGLRK